MRNGLRNGRKNCLLGSVIYFFGHWMRIGYNTAFGIDVVLSLHRNMPRLQLQPGLGRPRLPSEVHPMDREIGS